VSELKVTDLIADDKNANKGTDRGRKMVKQSLDDYGAGRSILIDKHGLEPDLSDIICCKPTQFVEWVGEGATKWA
jgi:hypothetical protein